MTSCYVSCSESTPAKSSERMAGSWGCLAPELSTLQGPRGGRGGLMLPGLGRESLTMSEGAKEQPPTVQWKCTFLPQLFFKWSTGILMGP